MPKKVFFQFLEKGSRANALLRGINEILKKFAGRKFPEGIGCFSGLQTLLCVKKIVKEGEQIAA